MVNTKPAHVTRIVAVTVLVCNWLGIGFGCGCGCGRGCGCGCTGLVVGPEVPGGVVVVTVVVVGFTVVVVLCGVERVFTQHWIDLSASVSLCKWTHAIPPRMLPAQSGAELRPGV